MPCPVHEAGEGAVRVSVSGRGGGGVCARGVCPALPPVGGTGRWAQRGGCAGQGMLPSDTGRQRREPKTETNVILLSVLFEFFLF